MAEQLIDAAIVAFVFTAAWILRRLTRTEPADTKRWQQITAARTEADVQEDLAKARAALDFATCIAIRQITPHDIPHQTRRTEEDQ
ncbi:hypothetical protein ACFV0B_11205 [Streptomyces xanthophaeus]|uniref:hypothetical protein n=1 Tax=Streptomyces xanthophaeus TaxID=67385 RepID=UPI0036BFC729